MKDAVEKISELCEECRGTKQVKNLKSGNYRCGYDKRVWCNSPPYYGTVEKVILDALVKHSHRGECEMKYQEEFAKLKLQKLKERHSKHGENSVLNPNYQLPPFKALFEHWKEECMEFIEGFKRGDLKNIREELADMSNMVDMMFEATHSKECAL